jgi:hypothetical protein
VHQEVCIDEERSCEDHAAPAAILWSILPIAPVMEIVGHLMAGFGAAFAFFVKNKDENLDRYSRSERLTSHISTCLPMNRFS